MAGTVPPTPGSLDDGDATLRIARAAPDDRREALGVLLGVTGARRAAAVEQFIHYSADQRFCLDELWLAWDGPRRSAAALIIPCPGRTGMLFVSPPTIWGRRAHAVAVVRHATEAQTPQHCRLVQALVEPQQMMLRDAILDAGYIHLAELIYMQRRADGRPHPLELPPTLRVLRWCEANRKHFARAIIASYEQTLDCPALRGVRPVEDVIEGHQAAGVFRPDMWLAVYQDDEPVAVMLLNEVPHAGAVELVYLGVSVPWRGRGIARQLMRHAVGLAAAAGCTQLILAVDSRNQPARRLYEQLHLRPTARKHALVRVIEP